MAEKKVGTSSSIPNYIPLSDNYQVFLNFSGSDTGKGFADFLYTYLVDVARIRTFRDDSKLRVGVETTTIGPDIREAIRSSEVFVPVISRNYADGRWCLVEFAEIVKCAKGNRRKTIMPVFYDVTPSEVRNQGGGFKEAFELHELNQEEDVMEWREAIKFAAALKGWELERATNGIYVFKYKIANPWHFKEY